MDQKPHYQSYVETFVVTAPTPGDAMKIVKEQVNDFLGDHKTCLQIDHLITQAATPLGSWVVTCAIVYTYLAR